MKSHDDDLQKQVQITSEYMTEEQKEMLRQKGVVTDSCFLQ